MCRESWEGVYVDGAAPPQPFYFCLFKKLYLFVLLSCTVERIRERLDHPAQPSVSGGLESLRAPLGVDSKAGKGHVGRGADTRVTPFSGSSGWAPDILWVPDRVVYIAMCV